MGNLFFWQRWPAPERIIFNLAALLFVFSIANLAYSYITTPAPVIEFQSIVESQLTEVPFESFRKGSFELTVPGNNYTITERLLGTPLQPNLDANYLWLICFVLCVTALLAVVTTLSLYYYLASMGVFILLVVSLKLETLLIFGRDDKAFTIGALLVYGLCSFHIYYFLPGLRFGIRLLYFLGVTVIMALVISSFSETALPALHMAVYSYQAGMIATVLFAVMVAHEIIAFFINILTRNVRQGRTLNHFLIITIIYLVNLVVAYALKFGFIKWNIFSIDLFLLLIISGVLGIWGIRQRQRQMDGIMDVEPHGVIGYVVLGAMAFGAIALFLGNANDPAYHAVADIIIFSHLGYGFIFLLYVISNFGSMLSNNMAVHKVLYHPNTMPFFTFRLAGLIATLALVIYNTWQVPAHNAVAGFQNAVADLYMMEENNRVAAVYFDQGRTYGFANHRSNYALANLAGLKFDHEAEKGFYKSASYLRPTEMSYLNWAQMWQSEQNNREATVVLREGLTTFPKSTAIANTLGLLYADMDRPDSAVLFLQKLQSNYSASNLLALAARKQLPLLSDTTYNQNDTDGLMCNKIAVATSMGSISRVPLIIGKDTSISISKAAYLNNYIINNPGKIDTAALAWIEFLSRREENEGLGEALLFSTALGSYSAGDIRKAFRLLEEVAIMSSNKGKYNNILGLWCLEQGEPIRGQGYIEYALSQEYAGAVITNAVTLTEGLRYAPMDRSGAMVKALAAWDSVKKIPDTTMTKLAGRMKSLLTAAPGATASMSDEDKYAFVRYRLQPWDTAAAMSILSRVMDPNIKSRGILECSQLLLDYDDVAGATALFDRVRGIRVTDTRLYDDLRLHERLLLAANGNLEGLRNLAESPLQLEGKTALYKTYFEALAAGADSTVSTKKFEEVARQSLFFDQGILDATNHLATHGTDPLRSYNLLVEAVQHHPSSVRLREAYIREAMRVGFTNFAEQALTELRTLIPPRQYEKFSLEIRTSQ